MSHIHHELESSEVETAGLALAPGPAVLGVGVCGAFVGVGPGTTMTAGRVVGVAVAEVGAGFVRGGLVTGDAVVSGDPLVAGGLGRLVIGELLPPFVGATLGTLTLGRVPPPDGREPLEPQAATVNMPSITHAKMRVASGPRQASGRRR
jgi:hypothetical protein